MYHCVPQLVRNIGKVVFAGIAVFARIWHLKAITSNLESARRFHRLRLKKEMVVLEN